MSLHTLFLTGLIPAAFLIWLSRGLNRRLDSRADATPTRWRYQLILALAAAALLLGVIGVAAWLTPPGEDRPLYPIAPFLGPALLAALALIVFNLQGLAGVRGWQFGLLLALGLVVIGLLVGLRSEQSGIVVTVLVGALVLIIAWLLGRASDGLAVILSLIVVLLLGWINRSMAAGPSDAPQWIPAFAFVMLYALPGMTVALAAVLVILGLKQLAPYPAESFGSNAPSWSRAILRFGLASLLLVGLAYTILWGSVWDQTGDGLTGIWFTTQAILVSIGAGVLITFLLKGRQVLVAAVFLLGVPVIMILAFSLGLRISNLEITAARAARLQRAVERFHGRYGWYPGSLDELTPRDLLWIPGPVILQGEAWCYQGDQNYYRLGAFYREFFSLPLLLKVYAQAGMPPETGWECGDRLAEMKARYDLLP
jgi:hypothetical protein